MAALGKTIEELSLQKLSDRQVLEYIDALFPLPEDASEVRKKNLGKLKEDLKLRYFEAAGSSACGKNAYRFVNAVSDFATHARPLRSVPATGKPVWPDRGWKRPDRSGIWNCKSCLKCIESEENDE